MKDKVKKDYKYLNVSIERDIYEEFNTFCKEMGMSKTGATEKALRMYMNKFYDMVNANNVDLGK